MCARLTRATLDWLRSTGGTVCRNCVFGWDTPSLTLSRSTGFEPLTESQSVTLTPDRDANTGARLADAPDFVLVADLTKQETQAT